MREPKAILPTTDTKAASIMKARKAIAIEMYGWEATLLLQQDISSSLQSLLLFNWLLLKWKDKQI